MSWTNFHTHCHFCNGVGEPQEYVDKATKQGLKTLGFSCHAPLPFPLSWTMNATDLARYCKSIRSLQQSNVDKLQIFLGLEIDFIPEVIGPGAPQFQSLGIDYTIGSVHFAGCDNTGKPWSIDDSEQTFAKGLDEIYKGDVRQVVESYYGSIRKMVRTQRPDIIGHFDLIKRNNMQEKYFSENDAWYKKAVFDTLQTISKSKSIVEVNTCGIARKRADSLYPSTWILERCLELSIPITLSSDAHTPAQITVGFEETATVLKNMGFKNLYVLGPNGWYPRAFSSEGLK